MKTFVYCTLQLEGIHNWDNCHLPEVQFLAFSHRHMFHFYCEKEVSHDDRDIEFIILKRKITKYLINRYPGEHCMIFNSMSCEILI